MKLKCYVCTQEFIGVKNSTNTDRLRKCQQCFDITKSLFDVTKNHSLNIVPDIELHVSYLNNNRDLRGFVLPCLDGLIGPDGKINLQSPTFKHYVILDGPNRIEPIIHHISTIIIKRANEMSDADKRYNPYIEKSGSVKKARN
jgi:hypothetical protein